HKPEEGVATKHGQKMHGRLHMRRERMDRPNLDNTTGECSCISCGNVGSLPPFGCMPRKSNAPPQHISVLINNTTREQLPTNRAMLVRHAMTAADISQKTTIMM
ncbi:unnamed protein product, partial [Ectocarpus sp. 12 AP-2014]